MHSSVASRPAAGPLLRGLRRLAEPLLLLPAFTVALLALIWGMTLKLVDVEHLSGERAAMDSSLELFETYEAQVVRALREIDQTLRFVKYALEHADHKVALSELRSRALLPPEILFAITIQNAAGDVVEATRASEPVARASFEASLLTDELSVGRPRRARHAAEWTLDFSRRIDAPDGSAAGVATISIDASYFVSGYESSKLGDAGFLGMLGTDGVFRVRRSGASVSGGDAVDYDAVVPSRDTEELGVVRFANPWDGVQRYTVARQLYEFPLAVIVGLSEEEEHVALHQGARVYEWRAAAGSVAVVLLAMMLGRMSWDLTRSRRREAEARLAYAERVEYLAYHDGLTGLPNRSLFTKLLERGIAQAHRYDRQLVVLFLDLDRFKHINDTLGHEAGDQLLCEVARRLTSCLRSSDTVARLGGDEFVALLSEITELRHVTTVAQKMLVEIGAPFVLMGQEFRVTASIGIAVHPQDGLDEQTLTKNADVAMYQAKLDGRNKFQFYSEALNANSIERFALESSLRHAVERGEFRVHYQAKRDTVDGHVTGVESLLRWQHPELGLLTPMQFIPIAEETGLILPIGRWALRTACAQSVAWLAQGLLHDSMTANLTARQFTDENLLRDVESILAETGMERARLELEIAEPVLMHDVERATQTLARLKDLGVRIAIDHFGIGYASLAAVPHFAVDTIKIDRSFLRNVGKPDADAHLTDAIVAMGRTLGVTVVAQGVESKEQAEFLSAHGCDAFQGFYFDQPVPGDVFAKLLQAQPIPPVPRVGAG